MIERDKVIERLLNCDLGTGSDYPSETCTELIEAAFSQFNTEDLCEILLSFPGVRDLEKISNILNIASWCGCENGRSSVATRVGWLMNSEDPDRLFVALRSEALPIDTDGIKARIELISEQFPQFRKACEVYLGR